MTTLDAAWETFTTTPTVKNAGEYLKIALCYWQDDMLDDESFGDHVARVARYLNTGIF